MTQANYDSIDTTLQSLSAYGLSVRLEDIVESDDIAGYIEELLLQAGVEGDELTSLRKNLEDELSSFNRTLRAQKYDLDRLLRSENITSLERVGIEDALEEIEEWITLTRGAAGEKDILDYFTDAEDRIDALHETIVAGQAYTHTENDTYKNGDVIEFTFELPEGQENISAQNTIFSDPVLQGQDAETMYDYDGDGILDSYYDTTYASEGKKWARDDKNSDGVIDEKDLGSEFVADTTPSPFFIHLDEGSTFSIMNAVPAENEDGTMSDTKFSDLMLRIVREDNSVYYLKFTDIDMNNIDFILTGAMGNVTPDVIATWPDQFAQNFFENKARYTTGYSVWHLMNGEDPSKSINPSDTYYSIYNLQEYTLPIVINTADAENGRTIVINGFNSNTQDTVELSFASLNNPTITHYEIDEQGRQIITIESDEGLVTLILDGAQIDSSSIDGSFNPETDLTNHSDIISFTGNVSVDPAVYAQIDATQMVNGAGGDKSIRGAFYGMLLLDGQSLFEHAKAEGHTPVFGAIIEGNTGEVIGEAILTVFQALGKVGLFIQEYNAQYGENAFETHYQQQLRAGGHMSEDEATAGMAFAMWLTFNYDEDKSMNALFSEFLNYYNLQDRRTNQPQAQNNNNRNNGQNLTMEKKENIDLERITDTIFRALNL